MMEFIGDMPDSVHAQYRPADPQALSLVVYYQGKRLVLSRNRAEPIRQTLNRLKIKLLPEAKPSRSKAQEDPNDLLCQRKDLNIVNSSGEMVDQEISNEDAFVEGNSLNIADLTIPILVNMPSIVSGVWTIPARWCANYP
jgi:hypothetical protein